MTGLGTDVLALTCVLCGAVASGGLTLALMDQAGENPTACTVEAVSVVPGLVVRGASHGHVVLLAQPRVALGSGDCQTVVRSVVDVDGIRSSVERVRVDVERARAEMEEARARVEEARARMEESRARGEEAKAQEIQVILERLDAKPKGGSY